jgi:hypothetical protein
MPQKLILKSMKDPAIELYKQGIDGNLIPKNLQLIVTKRFEQAMALQRFAEELRMAGRKSRQASAEITSASK